MPVAAVLHRHALASPLFPLPHAGALAVRAALIGKDWAGYQEASDTELRMFLLFLANALTGPSPAASPGEPPQR